MFVVVVVVCSIFLKSRRVRCCVGLGLNWIVVVREEEEEEEEKSQQTMFAMKAVTLCLAYAVLVLGIGIGIGSTHGKTVTATPQQLPKLLLISFDGRYK